MLQLFVEADSVWLISYSGALSNKNYTRIAKTPWR